MSDKPRPSWWRRIFRAALVSLLMLTASVVSGLFWFQTDAGQAWLREFVEQAVQETMGEGGFEIGRLDVRRFGVLELDGLVLTDASGREVVRVERARALYRIKPAARRIVIDELLLAEGTVDTRLDDAGELDLVRMFPSEDDGSPAPELPWPVAVQSVVLQDIAWSYGDPSGPLASGDLTLSGSAAGEGSTWAVDVLSAGGELTEPSLGPYTLAGRLSYDLNGVADLERLELRFADSEVLVEGEVVVGDDIDLDLTVDAEVDLDGLEVMTGDAGLKGRPNVELGLKGPITALAVEGRVLHGQGNVGVDLLVGVDEQITYEGTLRPRELDLTLLLDAVTEETTLTGELELDGAGVSWPDDLRATGTASLSDSVGWGYALPEAQATWALDGGVVTLTGFRYAADWCEVTGTGHLTETTMDVDLVADCRDLGGLAEFGVADTRGAAKVTGRAVADWSSAVTFDFDGSLVGWNLAYADYGRLDRYEGPVHVEWDDASGAFAAGRTSSIEGVSSYGAFIPTAGVAWQAVYTQDGDSSWEATFRGEGVAYSGAAVALVEGTTTGSLGADGHLVTHVDADLRGMGYDRFTAEWGSAQIHLEDTVLSVAADLFDGSEELVHVDGGGDYELGVYAFEGLRAGPATGVQWVQDRPVRVTLTETGVKDLDFAMSSSAGRVEAVGTLGTSGPVEALVLTHGLQLAYLSYLYPEMGLYVGTVDADLAVTGVADAVELDGILRASSLMVPGQIWGLSATVEMDSSPGHILVSGRVDDVQGQLLDFRGRVPAVLDLAAPRLLPREEVHGDAVLQVVDSTRLYAALPVLGPLPPCELAGDVTVGGTLMDPKVDLEAGLIVAGGQPQEWFRLDADVSLDAGAVTVSARGYDRARRLLTVDGEAETDIQTVTAWLFEGGPEPDTERIASWVPELDLRVVPLFVPVETLGHFVTMPPELKGKLSGAVRIHGNPERPEFGGGLQLTEAAVGDLAIAPAVVGLAPAEGGYQVSGTFGFSEGDDAGPHMLVVSGRVPFVLDLADFDLERELAREGLELTVVGDGLPLALARLADPAVVDASGLIRVNGSVAGSIAAPVPDLRIDLADGALTYADTGVRYPEIRLASQLRGPEWTIEELALRSKPVQAGALVRVAGVAGVGKVTGNLLDWVSKQLNDIQPLECAKDLEVGQMVVHGTARLTGFQLASLDLDVCSRAAWVSATEDMTLAVGTDLALDGPWPGISVTGASQVASGNLVFDEEYFIDAGTFRLDPNLTVIRADGELKVAAPEPDFWWPWDIDVTVDLNRATQLTAVIPLLEGYESLNLQELRLENAALDGRLRVHMHKDLLECFGEVSVLRGIVEVMNKDFKVARGELVFSGDPYNPALDLAANRNSGRYGTIGVRIGQNAEVPSLEFTSDQDLTNTDILSILLVGVPTSELQGGRGDLLAVAGLMAEGVLTEQAEGIGGNLFDSFQVSTTGDAKTDSSGQVYGEQVDYTATFGRNLGNRGYLEVEWDAALDDDEVSRWDLTVEFIITRRLQAEFTKTAEDGQAGADLLYTWKF